MTRPAVLIRLAHKPPPVQGLVTRPWIHEDRAMGCLDCRAIYAGEGAKGCPACGSQAAYSVARALSNRRAG